MQARFFLWSLKQPAVTAHDTVEFTCLLEVHCNLSGRGEHMQVRQKWGMLAGRACAASHAALAVYWHCG